MPTALRPQQSAIRKSTLLNTMPTVTPGKVWTDTESLSAAKLNATATPTVAFGNLEIPDASLIGMTFAKLLSGILTGASGEEKTLQLDSEFVILKSSNYVEHVAASDGPPPVAEVVGSGWALKGDGKLYVNFGAGVWRGEIATAGFTTLSDGTVQIGSGTTKFSAFPNGDFAFGSGGAIVGITHDGKLFAGGADYDTAVFSVDPAGNTVLKNTSQSMHSINIAAIDPTVLAPQIVPGSGAFTGSQSVSILCQTQGARIYYTVDGTTPTGASLLYSGPFTINTDTTIKAIAYKMGEWSPLSATATLTLDGTKAPDPIMDPVGGDYTPIAGNQTITIRDPLAGASIRYTTDGSTPTPATGTLISPLNGSTPPSANIVLAAGTRTVKAIAFKGGVSDSNVVEQVYYITTGGNSGEPGYGGRGNVP